MTRFFYFLFFHFFTGIREHILFVSDKIIVLINYGHTPILRTRVLSLTFWIITRYENVKSKYVTFYHSLHCCLSFAINWNVLWARLWKTLTWFKWVSCLLITTILLSRGKYFAATLSNVNNVKSIIVIFIIIAVISINN